MYLLPRMSTTKLVPRHLEVVMYFCYIFFIMCSISLQVEECRTRSDVSDAHSKFNCHWYRGSTASPESSVNHVRHKTWCM